MGKNKFEKYDSETLKKLVDNNWTYLGKIPKNRITKNMCKIAFENNPSAIKYFPERFKTDDFCTEAVNTDWQLFEFCSDKFINIENAKKVLKAVIATENINDMQWSKKESLYNILERLKQNKLYENIINDLKNNYIVMEKRYDKEKHKFIVVRNWLGITDDEVIEFKEFDDFYNYLDGNLINSEIYDYDFKGIDLKKYNIHNANIKSEILIEQGLYDDEYYNKNIKEITNTKILVPLKNEEEKSISMLHENVLYSQGFINYISKYATIYYISDIHLDYKITNRFNKYATKLEVEMYIKNFVKNMLNYANGFNKYLVIAGDIANSYEISKMFYIELVNQNKFNPQNIIVALGNHELWNSDLKTENNFESIVNLYKNLFNRLGITFLQNDLLLFKPELEIINRKQLMQMKDKDIQDISLNSKVTILGGIGFSGYNPEFNANNLIYARTITDLDDDKKKSNEFFDMYKKLKKAIPNKNIMILTHTPKQDWSNDNFNPNWIYVNGHTHINTYYKDNEKTLYADNQLGYYNDDVCLKRIDFSIKCNIFQYYKDGIYEITSEIYKEFYYKMGYRIKCNIQDGTIYLLKRYEDYLFLYKNNEDILYILNGGARNKLQNQDIKYYYDNMNRYANLIKTNLNSYYSYIKNVSEYVKSFGSSGNIHGAIVDIDYYNHLYVNIYDGKISPYFALSMVNKVFYNNLRELLKDTCPYLLENYDRTLKNTKTDLISIKNDLIKSEKIYYEDTRIYHESRILKKIQYLIEDNIIRIWKDDILSNSNIDMLMLDAGEK